MFSKQKALLKTPVKFPPKKNLNTKFLLKFTVKYASEVPRTKTVEF